MAKKAAPFGGKAFGKGKDAGKFPPKKAGMKGDDGKKGKGNPFAKKK